MESSTTQNQQTNDGIDVPPQVVIPLILIAILLIGGIWGYNSYLDHKMIEVCDNLNMTYSYRAGSSFYCIDASLPPRLKEIRYKGLPLS